MANDRSTDKPAESKKSAFQETLLLPKTDFPMKADLLKSEVVTQGRWAKIGIYERLLQQKDRDRAFTLHDGPPYANGSIHMGHLLNKVLKDLVVRTRAMMGYQVEFVPGWDCHGLPIEHRVQEDMKKEGKPAASVQEIRVRCEEYANKFKAVQATEMQRLGTIGDYPHPYYTMSPEFESATLELFAQLTDHGLVYRGLKPVHWSIENRTALAEAELEYKEREDPSVFVEFPLADPSRVPGAPAGTALLVWTTTPWTLPANLAVAAAPQGEYALYSVEKEGRTRHLILAKPLSKKIFELAGIQKFTEKKIFTGAELVAFGIEYRHPFIESVAGRPERRLFSADFVTLEDGTGLVHIAPGHGVDDYQMGLREKLEIYCPVKGDGTYDERVPEWLRGVHVWKANKLVCEKLSSLGLLLHQLAIRHSYPHDWRSKTPTIFRATEQWFIGVDRPSQGGGETLRQMALKQIDTKIQFIPDFGRNRLRGMLESRPDWCISRQRAWGLPIPAFYADSGETFLTPASVRAIAAKVKEKGSSVWFSASPAELLSGYSVQSDPLAPEWARKRGQGLAEGLRKGGDTFDVWFESGSSWFAVLKQRGLPVPADLYLEGSDQHRGWFQVSLLTGLGGMKQAPFKRLLTHGFMVDIEGKKMSKSAGNAVTVEQLLAKYGADIARWWVSSTHYVNDIKIDWSHFQVASEEYRKVRNTLRFLLGNIAGFNPAQHNHAFTEKDAASVDAWAKSEFIRAAESIRQAYEEFHFQRAHDEIFKLCNETLSAVYFSAIKDRLYCDPEGSARRRRTQTVLFEAASVLIRLIAPILVHTADEAWLYFNGEPAESTLKSIHLERFRELAAPPVAAEWGEVLELRSRVLKAVETEKAGLGLTNPLDCGVEVGLPEVRLRVLLKFESELADLCNLSQFKLISTGAAGESIRVLDLRAQPRCERSWKRDGTVKPRSSGALLSDRDASVVGA